MKILMMTNTFSPHVGGVARSVESFTEAYRARGHDVLVVAPEFEGAPEEEAGVLRIPAIQNFNGSDFSVVLPIPGILNAAVRDFQPQIIHSHHPFLLGSAALRLALVHELPLVFTHHTMYERYTHYAPGDSPTLKRFVAVLSTHYANQCDLVFAPSESTAAVIRERGVRTPIEVVPTGVRVERFRDGNGAGFRAAMGIPADAFLVGHLGRLAPEKNLPFLVRAVALFLRERPDSRFLVVGRGSCEQEIPALLAAQGLAGRLHQAGSLQQPLLAGAYRAMDVFAFASTSETQGMVLTEAMAAGVPAVALDAPGAREVVRDQVNGRLIPEPDETAFARALAWVADRDPAGREGLRQAALATAEAFSLDRTADRALELYGQLLGQRFVTRRQEYDLWDQSLRLIAAEWQVLRGMAEAAGEALSAESTPPRESP